MIGRPTPVTIAGVDYPSIKAAADALGITKQGLQQRLARETRGAGKPGRVKGKPGRCGKCGKTNKPGEPGHNARTCENL